MFDNYNVRIDKINLLIQQYGISCIKDAEEICQKNDIDVRCLINRIQSNSYDDAYYAFVVGAAIALKIEEQSIAKICRIIGNALQAFCITGSVADIRRIGNGHGGFASRLLDENYKCLAFQAGHSSFIASNSAYEIVNIVNPVRMTPLKVILNGLGKDAAQIISRVKGFTYVKTNYDYQKSKLEIVEEITYSNNQDFKVRCYGADSIMEGVEINKYESVDILITGNSCNAVRYTHPVVGIYKKESDWIGKKVFSAASGGGTGRTMHPDNVGAGPASYGLSDSMGQMHCDVQFAGSSSVPSHVEMMGFIGMGNNAIVGTTVLVAVQVGNIINNKIQKCINVNTNTNLKNSKS